MFLETDPLWAVCIYTTNSNTMARASAAAGPSTPRKKTKKRAAEDGTPAAKKTKAPRIDDDEAQEEPAQNDDPMAALDEAQKDPMEMLDENLKGETSEDGPVEESKDGHIPGQAPVRADEYELKAEREVDASKGLGGGDAADEGKLKLVHEVRHQVSSIAPPFT